MRFGIVTLGIFTQFALLASTLFDSVTATKLPGIVFSSKLVDELFDPSDALVVRTDTGAHFKKRELP